MAAVSLFCNTNMAAVSLFWNTNMAAVSLFWNTNMAAVTSRENTLLVTGSDTFSRPSRRLHVSTSNFHWFTGYLRPLSKVGVTTLHFGFMTAQGAQAHLMTTRSKWWRQNYKDLYGTLSLILKTKENVPNSQLRLYFTSYFVHLIFLNCS